MAELHIETDPYTPGRWALHSSNPSVLAAVPDAVVQSLELQHDALVGWGLHPDEQTELAHHSYEEERREIGIGPLVNVVELPRPYQHGVVWVDRYHLLFGSAPPALASRLLGLYAGSKGRMVLAVHHPSVSAIVQTALNAFPPDNGTGWEAQEFISQVRFAVRYEPSHGATLQLRAPQSTATAVNDAVLRLPALVAHW